MKKATSSSADDGKSTKPSQVKSGKKSAPKKATIGKQVAAAESRAKVPALPSLGQRIAEAKKLEALDRPKASGAATKETKTSAKGLALAAASAAHPLRNSNFPETYIQQISVKLDDPDHSVTLTWIGPQAAGQETGPFRSSPGAGLKGLNCDNTATSRRNGSKCTPKGTFGVSGFQDHLNSDSRATFVVCSGARNRLALFSFRSEIRRLAWLRSARAETCCAAHSEQLPHGSNECCHRWHLDKAGEAMVNLLRAALRSGLCRGSKPAPLRHVDLSRTRLGPTEV